MQKPIIILGAGSLGKVALDIFRSHDWLVYCFLDEDNSLQNTQIDDISILGSYTEDKFLKLIDDHSDVFVALDHPEKRQEAIQNVLKKRRKMPINAFHKDSFWEVSAVLGSGNLFFARSYVGTNARVGNHCILGASAIVDYEATLADNVQVGAGAVINAKVKIGEGAFIGSGATIAPNLKIGKNAKIVAGSMVLKDVADNETVFGMPAQKIGV